MGGNRPTNLEELRERVPLTTYADYAPYLLKRRMDVLPRKPILWQYTSGRSSDYPFLWAPVTGRQLEEITTLIFCLFFFASCSRRGEIVFRPQDKLFYGMAPPPYASGSLARAFPHEAFRFMPPVDISQGTSFEERVKMGFEMALSEGLDACLAMSSVTCAIGDRFSQSGGQTDIRGLLRKPKALYRLGKGLLKSRLAGRSMIPKDLWTLKGLITYGIDGSIYKEKIKEMWGRYPLDFHGCTEAPIIAMQTWDYQGMTFVPHLNLFEFIPEAESRRSREDPIYQPSTLLINQLTPGDYELVITSFHGGPFIRYRLGHMVRIISLRNEALDIDIPQMTFVSRVDDMIDIAGFTRLTEKTIWQAVENTGVVYSDWTARKEVRETPVLHLYIEPKGRYMSEAQVASMVHEEMKKLNTPYAEMESFLGLKPLEVTLLPVGAFQEYQRAQRAAGADPLNYKVPHIDPTDEMIDFLVSSGRRVPAGVAERGRETISTI
jgi:hypothetical protein